MAIRLGVQNLGPLARAEVTIGPLTVLVGPNNAGKSTLAMLSYAATRLPHAMVTTRFRHGFRTRGPLVPSAMLAGADKDGLMAHAEEAASAILAARHAGHEGAPDVMPIVRFVRVYFERYLVNYGFGLAREVERSFGSPISELKRKAGKPVVVVHHESVPWSVEVAVKAGEPHISSSVEASDRLLAEIILDAVAEVSADEWYIYEPATLLQSIVDHAVRTLVRDFPPAAYYLPAARSGLLQSHKLLASVLVSRSPLVGIEDMAIPKMSGVITDFLSHLLTLEPRVRRSETMAGVAEALEKNILAGEVAYESGPASAYPEISYNASGDSFPLHRTSSMVSELAPVVLFLRYLVRRRDLLIIEEPESHLHPASQVAFARAIAHLAEAGTQVMFTTHSDYFLSELNNTLRGDYLASSSPNEVLEGVTALNFCPSKRGTIVKSVKFDPNVGISDEGFATVAAQLYEEMLNLDEASAT